MSIYTVLGAKDTRVNKRDRQLPSSGKTDPGQVNLNVSSYDKSETGYSLGLSLGYDRQGWALRGRKTSNESCDIPCPPGRGEESQWEKRHQQTWGGESVMGPRLCRTPLWLFWSFVSLTRL